LLLKVIMTYQLKIGLSELAWWPTQPSTVDQSGRPTSPAWLPAKNPGLCLVNERT
jgi:hypothetical protein